MNYYCKAVKVGTSTTFGIVFVDLDIILEQFEFGTWPLPPPLPKHRVIPHLLRNSQLLIDGRSPVGPLPGLIGCSGLG